MKYLQRLFQKISTVLLVLVLGSFLLAPVTVAADPSVGGSSGASSGSQDAICNGIGLTGGSCGGTNSNSGVASLAATIINILSIIGGIIAVIMIVVGGFRYVTSGGDSNATAGARSTIVYALVGLLVIAVAQLVVHFVLGKLSGVNGL